MTKFTTKIEIGGIGLAKNLISQLHESVEFHGNNSEEFQKGFKVCCEVIINMFGEIESRHQTNADRIRSMEDEGLVNFLKCPLDAYEDCDCIDDRECRECILEWLKKPVEHEEPA